MQKKSNKKEVEQQLLEFKAFKAYMEMDEELRRFIINNTDHPERITDKISGGKNPYPRSGQQVKKIPEGWRDPKNESQG